MSEFVLFIHSTGTGSFMWRPYRNTVPQGIELFTPENIGYNSDGAVDKNQIVKVEDEISHLISKLPASASGVHLVAHSYGGFVALSLARRLDVPVRSLWIYEPVMFGSLLQEISRHTAEVQADVQALYSPENAMLDPRYAATDAWLESFIDYWNGDGAWNLMNDGVRAITRSVAWKMYQEVSCIAHQPLAFENYRFDLPLTLAYGSETKTTTRAIIQRLREENIHAQIDRIEGLDHMGVVAADDALKASLRRHWGRIFGA